MITLLTGDCREVLPTLPAASVHCVVTSPPYFGLRDYGVAGQIGLEATPEAFIAEMVAVFREVRRVLRDDGTCWVNLGDSYAVGVGMARGQAYQRHAPQKSGLWAGTRSEKRDIGNNGVAHDGAGLKPKDLLMMPARVALALQQDGWWLRSDIIWAKPNPMPESVTDRPTNAHEHVFLLTKRARYYYDAEAVREEASWSAKMPDGWDTGPGGHGSIHRNGREAGVNNGASGNSRNLRNVWTIATAPFAEAHFATFPPALVERCIRAGTSERGRCAQCGAPWVRVTSAPEITGRRDIGGECGGVDLGMWQGRAGSSQRATTGWRASCACNADTVPCTVLDPFSGSGTTCLVADRLGRDSIGIDLSHTYVEMARERLTRDAPLFADIADAPVPEPPEDQRMRDLFAAAADD